MSNYWIKYFKKMITGVGKEGNILKGLKIDVYCSMGIWNNIDHNRFDIIF